MNINQFISNYTNHPVLFVGTGVSLRYLKEAHTWDGLLKRVATELRGSTDYYFDIKSQCEIDGRYDFPKIASMLEADFNTSLVADRDGKFKDVNDIFYAKMAENKNLSRFKIYISKMLANLETKEEKADEIAEFKKVRKNVGSIITTNYDQLIESIFEFSPLIGNDILLSNPYGSVYKIHGCVSDALRVIITTKDYENFKDKYELIRAQLLSIFIHNPIIFLGYNIGDDNIKQILRTIFTYIETNSPTAKRIRDNFLLVEYDENSDSQETTEHDIDLENASTIRINKIKTDNFIEIYKSLSALALPISAMDVRKVQNIVKEIYAGGDIKVRITEDLDSISNSDKILAIGSSKTITYQYLTASETMANYFNIIEEANSQVIALIDKYNIPSSQFFPVFGFIKIHETLAAAKKLKEQQIHKLKTSIEVINPYYRRDFGSIDDILNNDSIAATNKFHAIFSSVYEGRIELDECENYLRNYPNKNETFYRKLLCAFDIKKYG